MSEEFKINKAYAEKYNVFRQKEELQKLKDKYGDVEDESDSSTSESEDENAEALTNQLEKDWLRTLAALKSKDPRIYQKDVRFYHSDDEEQPEGDNKEKTKKKKKDKPIYLKDYNRQLILDRAGIASDEESESEEDMEQPNTLTHKLGYHEEQEQLRKSLAAVVSDSDDGSSDDGLLMKAEKSRMAKAKEEQEYLEWLKGQKDDIVEEGVSKELAPLRSYWNKPDLDEGEKFLKNFILNKQYIDKDGDGPTVDDDDDDEDFSEEEELLTEQEAFERKYNFRFEEPGGAEIKSFPRTMEDSLRRKDTKRKEKRVEVKERKQKEKEQKMEELKQLKNLKRQEILNKIEKLKQITGNQALGINEEDLEEDFDPKKHDEMMQKYFDEEYYGQEVDTEEKPEFPDLEEAPETWDNWTGEGEDYAETDYSQGYTDPHVEDPDFCMDADYDPVAAMEAKQLKKQKKKKKSKLAQALASQKPVFDPSEKTFEQYFDEYYKLDYEDIIGDIPCRFKYRKVAPNNYGLTTDEILKAKDKELNKWVSVKKMVQYRTDGEEEYELRAYNAKGKNIRKKQNIFYSLFESEQQEGALSESGKKKKQKKQESGKKDQEPVAGTSTADDESDTPINQATRPGKHKMNRNSAKEVEEEVAFKKQKPDTEDAEAGSQSATEGKKRKKKKKKMNKTVNVTDDSAQEKHVTAQAGNQGEEKSGRKKKNKGNKADKKLKLSEERLKAYGINPKKYKYMQKEELHQIKPRKDKKGKETNGLE